MSPLRTTSEAALSYPQAQEVAGS